MGRLKKTMRQGLKWFVKNIIRAFLEPIVQLFYKPSPNFVVKLSCGLGNQMFQYAMGRALELRTGSDVLFDKSWYSYIADPSAVRAFELDIFTAPIRFVNKRDIPFELRSVSSSFDSLYNTFLRKLWFICGLPTRTTLYNYPSEGFKKDIFELRAGQNISFDGYWQSEKYFKDVEHVIRKDFNFRIPPDKGNQAILNKMAADIANGIEAVSVHIRRGDYSSNPKINASHGLLPLDYYRRAMSVIEKRCAEVCYYVFSDDLEWCRENLHFKTEFVFVDVNIGKFGWMDMRLMSSCRHHIIANSSFSWWGAWLNTNKDRIVIAPSPQEWFAKYFLHDDILPENWLRISMNHRG